jgi:DNA-binding MarR family transcriptional regulator
MLPAATKPVYIDGMCDVAPDRLVDDSIARFIRRFGLHRPQHTEDGQPVSMSTACLLAELRADGPLRQVELGERLGLDRGNISHAVANLVERGWVRRELPTTDRRGVVVSLTDQGTRAADFLAETRRARCAALLERIPAEHHNSVLSALTLMAGAAAAPAAKKSAYR